MTQGELTILGILMVFVVAFVASILFYSHKIGKEIKRLNEKYGDNNAKRSN